MNCQNNVATDCPCTADCPRHGKCCECVSNHIGKGNLPACLRFLKKDLKEQKLLEKRQKKDQRKRGREQS